MRCCCGCLLGYVFFRYFFFRKFNFACAQVIDIFEISLPHPAHTQAFVAAMEEEEEEREREMRLGGGVWAAQTTLLALSLRHVVCYPGSVLAAG